MTTPKYVHQGTARTCARCGQRKYHIAGRGLCAGCYRWAQYHHQLEQYPRVRGAS